MKKKEAKRLLAVVICALLLIVIIKLIQGIDSTKHDLKKLGYSKDEISIIIENTNKDEIKKILSLEYNKYLSDILTQKYYIPNNLEEYLEYTKKETNISKVISKVNVNTNKDFYEDTKETDISKGNAMLVNKYNYLPNDYEPTDIVSISNWYAYSGHSTKKEVYDAYVKMWKKAKEAGNTLLVNSSYRTRDEQSEEYDNSSDEYASRPGFSEHQTGLALDIVTYDTIGNDFENSSEFKWLQENSYKYGFILRYPKDKEDITGYNYESWHYRYLGVSLATKVHDEGITYDEYYSYYCEYKNEC